MRDKPNYSSLFTFFLLVIFCLILSGIYIVFYSIKFDFPSDVRLLHFHILGLIYLLFFGLGSGLMQIKKVASFKGIKYVWAFLWGAIFYSISVVYLLNYVSLSEWGQNISWTIVKTFAQDVPVLLDALPFNKLPIYLFLIGLPMIIFGFFISLANVINKGFINLGLLLKKYLSRPLFLGVFILLGLGLSVYVIKHRSYYRAIYAFKGEPIYNFFKQAGPNFGDESIIDLKAVKAHQAILENYEVVDFKKKNVVFIIVDALRTRNMGVYGYQRETTPFLSQLSNEGKLQKTNLLLSNCSTSFCGILSLLNAMAINKLAVTNIKLQDIFNRLDYKTHFLLVGSHNEWYQLRRFYEHNDSMDYYFDGLDAEKYEVNDDRALFEFFDKVPDFDGTPSFFYLHLMSVHKTGITQPDYQKYQPSGKTSYLNPDSTIMLNNYDNRVFQADNYLEQIYQKLEEKGFMEDALIVITADHGESVGERGKYGHSYNLYQESVHIPLLFYDTQTAAEDDLFYGTQIDIAPTILDKLNLPIPDVWDGHSILKEQPLPYFRILRQSHHFVVLLYEESGIYKYIYNRKENTEELFELIKDPMEQNELFDNPTFANQQKALKEKFKEEFSHVPLSQ